MIACSAQAGEPTYWENYIYMCLSRLRRDVGFIFFINVIQVSCVRSLAWICMPGFKLSYIAQYSCLMSYTSLLAF